MRSRGVPLHLAGSDRPDAGEGFDPERFLGHPDGQEHPAVYRPFGGGQRAGIGHPFATMEAAFVLVLLIPRFGVELPAHTTVGRRYQVPISMRPDVKTMRLRFKD